MSKTIINIITFGGIFGLLAFGYYLYSINKSSAGIESSGAGDVDLQAVALLRNLEDLKSINLDFSVLNDERFTNLQNYTQPLPPGVTGRNNPFAEVN